MKKIFVPQEYIKENIITIKGEDFHHIKNVLRKKVGDIVEISDFGWQYKAEIFLINSDSIKLKILEKSILPPQEVKIRLFQSIPKGKMEDLLAKTTELGVWEFYPIITERTIVKIDEKEKKLEKWNKIIIENAKKVGIPTPMRLPNIVNLSEINKFISQDEPKIVFWECEEENNLYSFLKKIDSTKPINILIGPEGGFSMREIELLKKSGWTTISLGKRIYTVETATLVSIANILYELENKPK